MGEARKRERPLTYVRLRREKFRRPKVGKRNAEEQGRTQDGCSFQKGKSKRGLSEEGRRHMTALRKKKKNEKKKKKNKKKKNSKNRKEDHKQRRKKKKAKKRGNGSKESRMKRLTRGDTQVFMNLTSTDIY